MLDILLIPGSSAIALHRLAHLCRTKGGYIGYKFSHVIYRINTILNAIDINPDAIIGKNCYFPHCVGIVIGPCTIGKNVTILQNVTIGKDLSGDELYPIIEDNVMIFTGSVIAGNITIGNGARIGALSLVMQDVPPNCLAVGCPARIIPKN